jgi:hypothetical protein
MMSPQRTFGPILLAPGVTPAQVWIFLIVLLALNFGTNFFSLLQPLVVSQQLGIPKESQGQVVGALATTQQAAVCSASPWPEFSATASAAGKFS